MSRSGTSGKRQRRAAAIGPEAKEAKRFEMFRRLPTDMARTVASFAEYSPAQQTVSKKWAADETERCSIRTVQGKSCVQPTDKGQLGLSTGCASYCTSRGPCVAWLESLLRNLLSIESVQIGNHQQLLPPDVVSVNLVDITSGNQPRGRLQMLQGSRNEWASLVPGMQRRRMKALEAAALACELAREYRAGAFLLSISFRALLDLEQDPVAPVFHGSTAAFDATAIPNKWSMSHSQGTTAIAATVDLWDAVARGCHATTLGGKSCLSRLTGNCRDYCLQRRVPCETWMGELVSSLESVNTLTATNTGADWQPETVTQPFGPYTFTRARVRSQWFEAYPTLSIVDRQGRVLVQLTRRHDTEVWSVQGLGSVTPRLPKPVVESYRVLLQRGPLERSIPLTVEATKDTLLDLRGRPAAVDTWQDAAALLCMAASRSDAKDLVVTVEAQLFGQLGDLIGAKEKPKAGEYSLKLETVQSPSDTRTYENPDLSWRLSFGDGSEPQLRAIAIVPLRAG